MARAWPEVGDCIMVLWEDISGTASWTDPEDEEFGKLGGMCVTVGYLLNDHSENQRVLMAATLGDNGMVHDVSIIPRGNVRQLWVLFRGEEVCF